MKKPPFENLPNYYITSKEVHLKAGLIAKSLMSKPKNFYESKEESKQINNSICSYIYESHKFDKDITKTITDRFEIESLKERTHLGYFRNNDVVLMDMTIEIIAKERILGAGEIYFYLMDVEGTLVLPMTS